MVAEALILDNVYPENEFNRLIQQAQRQVNNIDYNTDFGRFGIIMVIMKEKKVFTLTG